MKKFDRYDRVKIMKGKHKDKVALITEAEEKKDGDGYNYIVTGVDDNFYLRIDGDFIESAPAVTENNVFLEHLNESTSHTYCNEHPKFRIGDVVTWDCSPDGYHVVKESILVNIGESAIYMYEITPLYGDEDVIVRCKESSLKYEAHEPAYAKYFMESKSQNTDDNQNQEITPKFKVGDVVSVAKHIDSVYVINESVLMDDGRYMYIVSSLLYDTGSESSRYDTCEESALTFQYHDKKWEEYFTEGTRIKNDLPDWRGELYNMYACYADIATHGALNKSVSKEYENCTLPPSRMFHVMRSHNIYNRIFDVIVNKLAERRLENRKFMCNRLNVDDDELTQISGMVMDKLNAMNLEDMTPENLTKASKRDPGFTEIEKRFVALIDNLDISKKKFKDHFPVTMTALQMMDAIKQAYENAHKEGAMKIQKSDDPKEESLAAPHKGKRLYNGYSSRYNLTIEFWYNFDRDFIETAYPLGMNNNAKKHTPKTESVDVSESVAKPKFQVGNRVYIVKGFGAGKEGVILECGEKDYEHSEYRVRLDGESDDRIYYKKNMELIADVPYFESTGTGPKFRAGDVVYVIDTPYKTNVAILEAVSQDEASGEYIYKAALTFNGNIHQYRESELSYLYHDRKREIHKK